MNNIRLNTRDLSVKDRSSSMTALDRLETEECLENFNRLQPLLIQPAQLNLAVLIYIFLQFAKYVIINTPRRFVSKSFYCYNYIINI